MANNNGIDPMELLMEQFDSTGQYRMINDPRRQTPTMRLIPHNERAGLRCVTCGTNLSVKYRKVINGKEECFCNRCVLLNENDTV